jgi:transposase
MAELARLCAYERA